MSKPLKICMITTFYPPYNFGGDGIFVYRLSNALARRGHSIGVLHCLDAYRLLQSHEAEGEFPHHPNVNVHRLKSRAGFLSPLLTQQTGVPFFKRGEIKRILDTGQYDVIHYHNMSLMGLTVLEYGSAVKLYTTHEHWLVCPMHVLWKFNREVCTRKSCLLCTVRGKRPPQLWRYTGFLEKRLQNLDALIAPSRFTMEKHREEGLKVRLTHIPFFLPDSEVKEFDDPGNSVTPHRRPYFLFVGRLEKIKGVQNLIPIFKRLSHYDLLIAGEGSFRKRLENLGESSAHIHFLGKLDHDALRPLYRHAQAVIVPSICYEVFGMILLEAFSTKTPVIVNNLGALPEIVQESGGGFIYNTPDELIGAMKKLAEDTELRRKLGNNGYQAFLRYWTEERHIEMYMNLIEEIQNQRRCGTPSSREQPL